MGHIHCCITFIHILWHFTGFYGHPSSTSRHLSWALLRRIGIAHSAGMTPWLVEGDFNEIIYHTEKSGGAVRRPLWMPFEKPWRTVALTIYMPKESLSLGLRRDMIVA